MRKTAFFIYAVLSLLSLRAEPYPPSWIKFTLGDYVYDIQSDIIGDGNSKMRLLNICRANVAKQLEIKISESASLKKKSTNGMVDIVYTEHSEFNTNLEINLLKTDSYENLSQKRTYVIAYINKEEANTYYVQQLQVAYEKIKSVLTITEYLIQSQEQIKAGEELKKAQVEFNKSENYYKWLLIFGCNADKINTLQSQRTEIEHKIRQKLSFLSLYTESICILCGGAAYDFSCSQIVDKIKGNMSELSCSFTDDPSQADWIINFRLKAETDNTRSNSKEKFVKVSITGSAYCVNKKTTYPLYSEEYDSALSSPKAAEVILRRGKLINGITNDIINILKSK